MAAYKKSLGITSNETVKKETLSCPYNALQKGKTKYIVDTKEQFEEKYLAFLRAFEELGGEDWVKLPNSDVIGPKVAVLVLDKNGFTYSYYYRKLGPSFWTSDYKLSLDNSL